eukprot:273326_1
MSTFLLMVSLHIRLILCKQYINGDVSNPFTFHPQDHVVSHGGLARFILQEDGNLVMHKYVYSSGSWSYGDWATSTNGDHVELQDDGQLVVLNVTGGILWQSNSIAGTSPFRLIVTVD